MKLSQLVQKYLIDSNDQNCSDPISDDQAIIAEWTNQIIADVGASYSDAEKLAITSLQALKRNGRLLGTTNEAEGNDR